MSSEQTKPTTRKTLGLTGLTSNAMALIAPGAFLWLTYAQQSAYGSPVAASAMWIGIAFATALCLATAISYAELSKLYPGAGSSYFFAEQAFISKSVAYKWARIAKFTVGWASHLYYWVYPGLMVGVTALVAGYMMGQIWPSTFSSGVPSPLFMYLFCIAFSLGVAYIAYRGIAGTTGVNVVINAIQIIALLIFSVMAIGHRVKTPEGAPGWTLDSTGSPTQYVQDTMPDTTKTIADPKDATKQIQDPAATVPAVDKDGNPVWTKDDKGKPVLNTISYQGGYLKDATGNPTFNYHESAKSVIHWHGFSYVIVQACIAILILVGFESVTAMGEEAKDAKRDIPRAVILSLLIQGGFCYLLEYFAANYFLSSSYTSSQAAASSAPIGDQMQLIGAWAFGSARAGWWYMMSMAVTVLLALVGTTLSCMSTGARVTYAMGRDEEMGAHFGMLHGRNLTPHRAIWTLAVISAVIGIASVFFNFCGPVAQTDATITGLPKNIWYSMGIFSNATALKFPCSLIVVTLVSNFGTFLLYMMTCIVAMVAFREHHTFHGIKHVVVPIFGLLANLLCMVFYLVGPFMVPGMSKKEPFFALGIAAVWGIYGAIYFLGRSKATGRTALLQKPAAPVLVASGN